EPMPEGFPPVHEHHRHVIREAGLQLRIAIDVDLLQHDGNTGGADRRFGFVAEGTVAAGGERPAHAGDSSAECRTPRRSTSPEKQSSSPAPRAASDARARSAWPPPARPSPATTPAAQPTRTRS